MKLEHFVTLSLNPALDTTLWVTGLDHEFNDVLREQQEAAGKAVNVARVLTSFGCPCKALILAGEGNRGRYFERLDEDNLDYEAVFLQGDIRENISIVKPDESLLRLTRPGFTVYEDHIERVKQHLSELITPGTLTVVAGKNPRGLSSEAFIEICAHIKSLGGILAIDTSSATEKDICTIRPWVIKPNIEELKMMTGEELDTREKLRAAFSRFHQSGVQHILLSLGSEGLVYSGYPDSCGESPNTPRMFYAKVPHVRVKSTVGAGDCTLSGFLLAYRSNLNITECLRLAASFGTASVMIDGTNPPRADELEEVYPQVEVREE